MADFDSEFFIDYSSLDDFQRQLIDRKNNKSMVVSGSAGSGKSKNTAIDDILKLSDSKYKGALFYQKLPKH